MSKQKSRTVWKRMTHYVSRHSVERRLEQYTTGHGRLALYAVSLVERQAVTKARLAQYVAKS